MGGRKGGKGGKGRKDGDEDDDGMEVDTEDGVPPKAPKPCHKCGNLGHIQRNCPQNADGKQGKGSQKCPHCNQTNPKHTAEQCYRNPASPNFKGNTNTDSSGGGDGGAQSRNKPQPKYIGYIPEYVPPYNGEQMYCQICNSTNHAGSACTFPTPHLYNSTMVCRNCCLKGHTDADCRHPDPINCKICHRSGHKAETCRDASAELYKHGSSVVKKDERFIWGSFDPNANVPGPKLKHEDFMALEPQYKLERKLEKIELQQDQLEQQGDEWQLPPQLDQHWLASERQAVADKSIVKWPGQKEPLHFIPLRHSNVLPASTTYSRPYKVTKPQGGPKSTPAALAAAKYAQTMNWIPTVTRANIDSKPSPTHPQIASLLQNMNASEEVKHKFVAVFQRMREEEVGATQKQVRAYIDRSTRLYRKQNYNTKIQQLSLRIVENNVLSDSKLLQVQFAMGQGMQFWRDPKAMEALAKYQRPVCYTCGKQGTICDSHIRPINPEAACANDGVAVLQIPDYEDWGVFVVFDCQCCNLGYSWVERLPPPAMSNSEESLHKR